MCGRYSFVPTDFQIENDLNSFEFSGEAVDEALIVRYNIAPTQQAYVVTADEPRKMQKMNWGLVPSWSKDISGAGRLINARAEGIENKPSFRHAFKKQHCLVPADSFYEWREEKPKKKIPYRILRRDGHLLFFAGLWEIWKDPTTDGIRRTFTIITTRPNQDVMELHDRMPVVLPTVTLQRQWLKSNTPEEALELLVPAPDGLLEYYRISELLNSPKNEGAGLHQPVSDNLRDGDQPDLFTQ